VPISIVPAKPDMLPELNEMSLPLPRPKLSVPLPLSAPARYTLLLAFCRMVELPVLVSVLFIVMPPTDVMFIVPPLRAIVQVPSGLTFPPTVNVPAVMFVPPVKPPAVLIVSVPLPSMSNCAVPLIVPVPLKV
jgi:hypothetical protein